MKLYINEMLRWVIITILIPICAPIIYIVFFVVFANNIDFGNLLGDIVKSGVYTFIGLGMLCSIWQDCRETNMLNLFWITTLFYSLITLFLFASTMELLSGFKPYSDNLWMLTISTGWIVIFSWYSKHKVLKEKYITYY